MMAAGKLPNFARLAREGTFKPLATTAPPLSPVAWSSFQTGVTPARHNIFDFLTRDRRTYLPDLSSARIRPPRRFLTFGKLHIPLGKPELTLLRKSKPFWSILGEYGIFSNVIRVPITFPPEKFYGVCLAGMCVPDILGTQGTFTYYCEGEEAGEREGGQVIPVQVAGDATVRSYFLGPTNPVASNGTREPIRAAFEVKLRDDGRATLTVNGVKYNLHVGVYTDWIPVTFRAGWAAAVRGICRIYLKSARPFQMYVTPINIDPDRPALPISHPGVYAVYLSKLLGRYATLGLAEDTWALNEGVLDEGGFLEQVWRHHREREAMLADALAKTRRGVVVCVFDTPDRVQHMFYRYRLPDHPANARRDTTRYAGAIEETYVKMDELVGKTLNSLADGDVLFVISDHGFAPFARGVNLNTWLEREGYLRRRPDTNGGKWLGDVDWAATRAYAIGLAGIYLNVRGREGQGIVEPSEVKALKLEIKNKLTGLKDDATGEVAIKEVYDVAEIYHGPYVNGGPDLIIGYNPGWRASWDGATGRVGDAVFEDNVRTWSGDHCVAADEVPGVLFANVKVNGAAPRLIDIAPTALDLFGVPIPPHVEGQPLDITFSEKAGAYGET